MLIGAGIGIPFQQNVLARLLGSAEFFAPLTHSAIPTRAAFGTTGTFTRATTSTWQNNDGYMVTGVAGEIGFVGARRVRNLLTFTEDFSNAVWAETGLTKTATTLTEQATGADHSVRYTVASGKNVFQIKVKPNGRTRCALASTGSTLKSAIFNLTTASVEGALTDAFTTLGDTPTITLQSDGYYLLTMGNLSGSSTLVDFYMLDETSTVRSYVGDITKGMFLKQAQLEDVTAQTTQTAGEYVSVGVESAPYYHGSFVDGVKCFPTDLSGNQIPSITLLGYQAQGARTNLCLQSQTFDNASWTKTRATVSTTSVVCPDGVTRTTSTIAEDGAAANSHLILQATPVLTAAAHTVSVYAKAAARSWFSIGFDGLNAYFNLVTGAVGSVEAGLTASIASAGNGWYRCIVYRTVAVSASKTFALYVAEGDNDLTFNGLTQDSVYVFGAQVELGSFASSYIATTTTAQARNRDQLAYSAAGNLDETEDYWVYAEHTPMYQDTGEGFAVSTWNYNDGVGNAGMMLRGSVGGVGDFFTGGNGALTGATTANTAANGVSRKIVVTASGAVAKVCMNGGAVATGVNSKPALPATTMYIGANAAATTHGNVGPIYIGRRLLSDSEMRAIAS